MCGVDKALAQRPTDLERDLGASRPLGIRNLGAVADVFALLRRSTIDACPAVCPFVRRHVTFAFCFKLGLCSFLSSMRPGRIRDPFVPGVYRYSCRLVLPFYSTMVDILYIHCTI